MLGRLRKKEIVHVKSMLIIEEKKKPMKVTRQLTGLTGPAWRPAGTDVP